MAPSVESDSAPRRLREQGKESGRLHRPRRSPARPCSRRCSSTIEAVPRRRSTICSTSAIGVWGSSAARSPRPGAPALRSFRDTLAARGLDPDEAEIPEDVVFREEGGYQAMLRLLSRGSRPPGVRFQQRDDRRGGEALCELGVSMPRELSLVRVRRPRPRRSDDARAHRREQTERGAGRHRDAAPPPSPVRHRGGRGASHRSSRRTSWSAAPRVPPELGCPAGDRRGCLHAPPPPCSTHRWERRMTAAPLSRRMFLRRGSMVAGGLALASVGSSLLAACGSDSDDASASSSSFTFQLGCWPTPRTWASTWPTTRATTSGRSSRPPSCPGDRPSRSGRWSPVTRHSWVWTPPTRSPAPATRARP